MIKPDIVDLTNEERAVRAERLAHGPVPGQPPIFYFINSDYNGGRDPSAYDCASHWKDKNGKLWLTADCVGFGIWTQGAKRKLKTFPHYGGSINTDSSLLDARTVQRHFKPLNTPYRGCLIVMPGVFNADGSRKRPGHYGVVVGFDAKFDPTKPDLQFVHVAHCSPRHHKVFGQAIGITDGKLWASRDGWQFLEFVA